MTEGVETWLVRVAKRAGLTGGIDLTIPETGSPREAWAAISEQCGVSEDEFANHVAHYFHLQVADLTAAQPAAIKLVPADVARRCQVFPLRLDYRQIVVATSDPTNLDVEQALGFASGRRPIMEIAPPAALEAALENAYSADLAVAQLLDSVDAEPVDTVQVIEDEGPEAISAREVEIGPIVKLANLVLREAIGQGASDVHIQPGVAVGRVRFRVDGVLRDYLKIPNNVLSRVVSRIKVVGGLDIADRLRPQDGRARIAIGGGTYDLRISTVPTRDAEKAVVRVLDPTGAAGVDGVGFDEYETIRFKNLLSFREGIVLVTGPTGCGKTTTMYAALRDLCTEDVNIITVEDPVEYELPGLTQIQVEEKQGVTFASALRAVLRQDPDVIFVGEIRDAETAQIAVQASLTGHLVLATLHTNDAVGVIRRLTNLGLQADAICDTLRGAVAQRLARRLCPDCQESVEELTESEQRLQRAYGVAPHARAAGCHKCGETGYRGRIPLGEVFVMNKEIEALVHSEPTSAQLRDAAVGAGMRLIRDGALQRVVTGETTLEELERVLGDVPDDTRVPTVERRSDAERAGQIHESDDEEDDRVRVLLVDDDGAYRTVAKALLEKTGYHVTEADDGSVALERLAENTHFSLVVLDLDMPMVGGREVLAEVRSVPATAGLPVIVMTASKDPDAELRLLEEGADDYIRKPVDPNTFMVRVKATLRRAGS